MDSESIGVAGKYGGWAGQILWVDLSRQKVVPKPLDEELALNYLGGTGFAARWLFDLVGPEVDPFSPDNVFILATGVLTGTIFPQASRHIVAAKSPLTDVYGEAHAAGHFGAELKFAGFDAVVVTGRSDKPVYIYIEDGKAEVKDASHLWGRTTYEAEEIIKEEIGDRQVKAALIGQAGENLVRFAGVFNDHGRAAARAGIGAVMGSKRLKAIAARGYRPIKVARPDEFYETMIEYGKRMLAHPFTPDRVKYGTNSLVELMQAIGRLPAYNHREGVFDEWEKISGERVTREYLLKPKADFACYQRCGRFVRVPSGKYAMVGKGPEYEGLDALGANVGNSDLEALIYANHLCNLYGMDVISAGGVIAWAMECWENGLLTKEDTGGLELEWGDPELIVQLIEMIALRKGFGDLLAEGVYRAAKKIGRGTEKYAMHVKKMEIAAQDGRAQKSMGLAHATSNRGADHLYAFPVLDEVGFEKDIVERFGEQYLPEMTDRLNPKYKGIMVAELEDFGAVVEAVGVCKYGTIIPPVFFYPDLAEALTLVTGKKYTEADLRLIGARIVNLQRLFNVREGLTRKDDTLPDRFTKEPMPRGPAKGQVVELDQMLDEYYQYRNWDVKTGIPRKSLLSELGLEKEAEELERRGIRIPP
ncbi:MAG: aldehyde ferredoxin oxidoreductase family protein [Candidatus Korarchaeota archaeon]|nr:aldehyde ferredoxin oxidoreductase family protein [Candidatus Korarchaeota archaeon]